MWLPSTIGTVAHSTLPSSAASAPEPERAGGCRSASARDARDVEIAVKCDDVGRLFARRRGKGGAAAKYERKRGFATSDAFRG